ncbi:hypothetical protein [Brevibacterium samyangense]|uniref:Uncharacterized protein n=1 Tax=Brevibacterium samyangense TaxID=366888 RepID=A0ABP5EKS9_9MICO
MEKRNAIDSAMTEALDAALDALEGAEGHDAGIAAQGRPGRPKGWDGDECLEQSADAQSGCADGQRSGLGGEGCRCPRCSPQQ